MACVLRLLVLDVRSREDVESKVPAAIEAFGGVDVLVNNAGLAQGLDPFQDSTVEDAVTMINTNVLGLLYVTKAVLPFMIDKNEGHIVNMGSTAGFMHTQVVPFTVQQRRLLRCWPMVFVWILLLQILRLPPFNQAS